jgi:Na+/H+ antiporter NhaD/arsenite permease-like protein
MTLKFRTIAKKTTAFAKKESFFLITLLLTFVLSFFSRPHSSAIDWNVISTLFSLMLICLAFEECQLLTSLASLALGMFKTPGKLGLVMIFATGTLAMFVTNDVALLTVVPLTMMMAKLSRKDPLMLIVLETMSANIFSALTPFGNPQNLYLYSYFKIPFLRFFGMMLPFGLLGAVLMVLINMLFNKGDAYKVEAQKPKIRNKKLLYGASTIFLLNILSVFRVVDYRIVLATTLLLFLCFAPRLIIKIDYLLLLTFVLFFLFTDSVMGIPLIKVFLAGVLNSKLHVLLLAAGISQIISNVPAAVLISGFTKSYKEVLYGVSAGGLGTLIASLASFISYRLYIREYKSRRYIKVFSILNFGALIILMAALILIDLLY